VILIPEIKKIEPVSAHELQLFADIVYLIKIQVKHKDIVMKTVLLWRQPVVHYAGFIEAGIHCLKLRIIAHYRSTESGKSLLTFSPCD
jgi:hypothetical protein